MSGTTMLAIDAIVIGERRREDYGDLGELAESIRLHGLIHPIVVDDQNRLVAGERRLRACKLIGLERIEVRSLGDLSDDERQAIELEENERRKDLTTFERAKEMARCIAVAVEQDREEFRGNFSAKLPGRPQKAGSLRRAADRLGVDERAIRNVQQQVATAETYPVMQGEGWKQYHVLHAKEQLDRLPEADRAKAIEMIDQPGIPPKDAVEHIANLAEMPAAQRQEVFDLLASDDPRDQSLARTRASKRAPMPDPRINLIQQARTQIRKAANDYPNDPEAPRLQSVVKELGMIVREISKGQGLHAHPHA